MMRRRIPCAPALVFFVYLFLPAAASAQSAITGIVKDTTGAVMPGVTVEATSPALIERARTVSPTRRAVTRWSIFGPASTGDLHSARVSAP